MAAERKDGTRPKRGAYERRRDTGAGKPVPQHSEHNPADSNLAQDAAKWSTHAAACARLFSRADGWLRAVPDFDTGRLYVKWKFTAGRYAGHYVMAVHTLWSFDEAVSTLLDKLDAVDSGARRPTRDNYYGDNYANAAARDQWRQDQGGLGQS